MNIYMSSYSAFDDSVKDFRFSKTHLGSLFQNTLYDQFTPTSNKRLENLTQEENQSRQLEYDRQKVYNLTLKNIFINVGKTIQDVMQDFLLFRIQNVSEFVGVFVKGDRLLYIGILMVIISLFLAIINIFRLEN